MVFAFAGDSTITKLRIVLIGVSFIFYVFIFFILFHFYNVLPNPASENSIKKIGKCKGKNFFCHPRLFAAGAISNRDITSLNRFERLPKVTTW